MFPRFIIEKKTSHNKNTIKYFDLSFNSFHSKQLSNYIKIKGNLIHYFWGVSQFIYKTKLQFKSHVAVPAFYFFENK